MHVVLQLEHPIGAVAKRSIAKHISKKYVTYILVRPQKFNSKIKSEERFQLTLSISRSHSGRLVNESASVMS